MEHPILHEILVFKVGDSTKVNGNSIVLAYAVKKWDFLITNFISGHTYHHN